MQNPIRRIPDALVRVLAVFVLLLAVVLLVRSLLPSALVDETSFVKHTVEKEIAKPLRYAGSDVCIQCHEEQHTVKQAGYHRTLSCETCHGAAIQHAEDPTEVKPNLPKVREFCSRCHEYNPSRPTGFPQITPAAHNPLKACISCHMPHDPKPPSVPQECQACHAQIARTKAMSLHVQLECTTCHGVPEQHRLNPRAIRASVPLRRDFCGKCHSPDSPVEGTPKVDLATHGEKYLCWQCHYPHMPEVN